MLNSNQLYSLKIFSVFWPILTILLFGYFRFVQFIVSFPSLWMFPPSLGVRSNPWESVPILWRPFQALGVSSMPWGSVPSLGGQFQALGVRSKTLETVSSVPITISITSTFKFSGKVKVLVSLFTFFYFHSAVCWDRKVH